VTGLARPLDRPHRIGGRLTITVLALALTAAACADPPGEPGQAVDLPSYRWTLAADDAPWGGRAGLQVVDLDGTLFIIGGRTPRPSTIPGDSDIWADVWRSTDEGRTWEPIGGGLSDNPVPWPARAYFQAVIKDGTIFVVGGQDFGLEPNPFCELLEQGLKPPPGLGIDPDAPCPEFLPTSRFFNDVWASTDGIAWEERTADAPWAGRAGLSVVALGDDLFVLGGSRNDDASLIGPSGPEREYFNDVWRSADGAEWELLAEAAPWEPRAGAALVAHRGAMWLFGGEAGFTCEPVATCTPPYFNDVWRSTDGSEWTLVSPSSAWSPRPGHQCEVLGDEFVCFGGFGLQANPTDAWYSADGVTWSELPEPPWAAGTADDIRYDFASITIETDAGPAILTVGGDRETFDFDDPENHLRIEDDVWLLAPPPSVGPG
jgi:hypothetical protein